MAEYLICECIVCREHRKKDNEAIEKYKTEKRKHMQRIRNRPEYKTWQQTVLQRDNHCCAECNSKERIETHHIQSVVDCSELSYISSNGISLCHICHLKKHAQIE